MVFRFDRSQLVIIRSIVSTIGFVLPLVLGVITGHIIEGVSIAGGASSLGSVSLTSTHRIRLRTMILVGLGVAISACIGALTEPYPWLSILTIGIWSFATGLLLAINQNAMIIGLQSTIAMIILTHFTLSPVQALLQALLMFIGALLQIMLSVIPFRQKVGSESQLLITIYQSLADYAEDPNDIDNIRQISSDLRRAEDIFTTNKPVGKKAKIFYRLFEQAGSIRLRLTIMSDTLQLFIEQGGEQYEQTAAEIRKELKNILNAMAEDITQTALADKQTQRYEYIDRLIKELVQHEPDNYKLQQIQIHYKSLRAHLRNADKLNRSTHKSRPVLAWRPQLPQWRVQLKAHTRVQLKNPLSTIQANLTLQSTVFRHAIRLAIVMVIASMIYRFSPLERSYWIPISAILVLRPDFTTTFTRGIARLLGTMLGALSISLLLDILPPTYTTLLIIEVIVTFGAYALLIANYGMFSYFMTIEIIVLLNFVDKHTIELGIYRTVDTIIGGMLALIVYLLWPTWEHLRISTRIADRLEALNYYYIEVINAYIDPDNYDPASILECRKQARLARTNAEASVNQALKEPEKYPFDKNTTQCMLTNAEQIAENIISLEAYLLNMPSHPPLPMLAPLEAAIAGMLESLSATLRGEQTNTSVPDVDSILRQLEAKRSKLRTQDKIASARLSFVLFESRLIISNIHAMQQLLYTQIEAKQTGDLASA
ncbi:membrane protein [Dictyobacter vulcani]|uniref:Membrane protein n=2 Tax=Dictyobacter vulcani TaxID=2607529 RepID=A0A5J4KWI7_9CHLR|nr:membrane protein [Dictyobacter vulcani]